MKGTIVVALGEMVQQKFGKDFWREILKSVGLHPTMTVLATEDIADETVINVIKEICKRANLTMEQAADAFGEYWVNVYAPRVYQIYYLDCKSARDFITKMDDIHVASTKNIPGSKPPRFDFKWEDDNTLIMSYKSHRGLIDLMVGLIKGVGKYYKEDLRVHKISDNKVKIIFP
jgi:hypothetical protein